MFADIERSKSNRARCLECGLPIKDDYRIKITFVNGYIHVYCAGIMLRKLRTMCGWGNPPRSVERYIAKLLETEPRE